LTDPSDVQGLGRARSCDQKRNDFTTHGDENYRPHGSGLGSFVDLARPFDPLDARSHPGMKASIRNT
jgi:hypothetical protein